MTDLIDVELVPRAVPHGARDGGSERGVFYLGQPYMVPLDPADLDGDLRAHAEGRIGAVKYQRLVVNLSLAPRQGEPFRHVVVNAVATAVAPSPEPILFRAASPLRHTTTVNRSSRLAVTSDQLPVSPELEWSSQHAREEPYLVARGIDTDTVQWEFHRTTGHVLDGSYELKAVLEIPLGVTGGVLLSASATIRKKRLGLIGYRARLDDELSPAPFA
ncbi:hypothetical protein [Streptomyces triticirhizae]|uniref:Uncharacterized protein n=1 Tax=Streptomyces triticirhizae TaxID=2483353 RepID=A0A3M2KTX2_9ACTN|nr:hypothetical protein [Streptomyces triticirhizae]RMI28086.1 hypothetical protein EBN88_28605 [Streptomyces triticirhizae]